MTRTYSIRELFGAAWENAIERVGTVLGESTKTAFAQYMHIERIAERLNVRFDCNGNIVTEVKPTMQFKRVWLFGGEDGRDGTEDFVIAYIAENGKKIEVKYYSNTVRAYVVGGREYEKLAEAKAACL